MKKRILSMLLVIAMLTGLSPISAQAADFSTTDKNDSYNFWTQMPTSCAGKTVLALYHQGSKFPGEPALQSGGNYVKYNTSFQTTTGDSYFSAAEILQNVLDGGDLVKGSSGTAGVFDPNGVDAKYFTQKFKDALAEHEQDMIADVIEAKNDLSASQNPADYEIVWYVIKYQYYVFGGEWHINGLIREKDKYSVGYDKNGGEGAPPYGQLDMSYTEAQEYKVQGNVGNPALSKQGYTFAGWTTEPDGSGTYFAPNQQADLTQVTDKDGNPVNSITLYAKWNRNKKIEWVDGYGTIIHMDTDLKVGDTEIYNGITPTKQPTTEFEYVFDGWSTVKEGDKVYEPYDTITVTGDMTLYAHFVPQERTYTVTWVNHSPIHEDKGLKYESTVTYDGPEPTRKSTDTAGFLFDGWSVVEDGDKVYEPDAAITVTEDMTLYAHFEPVSMQTVTWYSADGANKLDSVRALNGSTVTYSGSTPQKENYVFDGWSKVASDHKDYKKDYNAGARITVNGDMNLYAHFAPKTYTVTWKNHDGSVLETDENVPYDATPSYDGEKPEKEATPDTTYTFIGWDPEVSAVTGDITYTAQFTDSVRQYTVIWKNHDGATLKTEKVNHGVLPEYTGEAPTPPPDTATHTQKFVGWTPKVSAVPDNADENGVITYTADFDPVAKLFTATVKVWADPTVGTDGGISGDQLKDIDAVMDQDGVQFYLRSVTDHSITSDVLVQTSPGVYTIQMPAGEYEVMAKNWPYDTHPSVTKECIVLPLQPSHSGGDPDSTTADLLFYSITYDANEGTINGKSSMVKYYQRGTAGKVDSAIPVKEGYDFLGWVLDPVGDLTETSPTVSAGAVISAANAVGAPHVLKAKWTEALRANVTVNVVIHHHDATRGGINPNKRDGTLKVNLTHRDMAVGGTYFEKVGFGTTTTNWYPEGNTVTDTENGTCTTTVSNVYSVSGLPNDWEYSANVTMDGYWRVGDPVIVPTKDKEGNWSYDITVTLQYNPKLFKLNYTVQADESVPDEILPTAVDLKILSWDATEEDAWAPISRHKDSSVDVRFDEGDEDTDKRSAAGSYNVPVFRAGGTSPYHYRVAVAGFTLKDKTELSAYDKGADLVSYYSTATGSTAVYQYAGGAYRAVVKITGGASKGNAAAVYGTDNTQAGYTQVGNITVTVYANAPTVTLDHNGGTLKGSADDTVLENQFRIPTLTDYNPVNGAHVFEGWYVADSEGKITADKAVSGKVITEDVTLVAKWKEPLTVSGQIFLSTAYDGTNPIDASDLPETLVVELERTDIRGVVEVIQIKKDLVIDYNRYASSKFGVVDYAFDPVPLDGSTYRVHVRAANYKETFLNEPESNTTANLADFTQYTADNRALDGDNDKDALVYAYLQFEPADFDLKWKMDFSQIGDDTLRPDNVGVLVLSSSEKAPSASIGDDWKVIAQQKNQNGTYEPKNTAITSDVQEGTYDDVWQNHPKNFAYQYAVEFYQWTEGEKTTVFDSDTAPFTVSYLPNRLAWYENGRQVTNTGGSYLDIKLQPKTYHITYDLNADGEVVQGMNGEPTSHVWSHQTAGIPLDLKRDGYDFQGWKANVSGYGVQTINGESEGVISADTAQDVVLTAQWAKQKKVTFAIENGTWNGTNSQPIVEYVSLQNGGQADLKALGLIPTAMQANYGFGNGSWGDDAAFLSGDAVIVSGTEDVTYTYRYEQLYVTVNYAAYTSADKAPVDTADSMLYYGSYVQIVPAGGKWQGSTENQYVKLESDTDLEVPVRDGYLFAGWNRMVMNQAYSGSRVIRQYTAVWLRNDNGDDVPDIYQKKIVFRIENGIWDGVNDRADRTVYVTLTDGNGNWSATGTATIPADQVPDVAISVPNAGFVKQDAFWSPALPAGLLVKSSDPDEMVFTYRHYTTITYADFEQDKAMEEIYVLPGTAISVDPNGGVWNQTAANTELVITGSYLVTEPTYENHTFQGWKWTPGTGGIGHIFTAQWELVNYEVIWKNYDGTVLETDAEVPLGTVPTYDGAVPTKPADAQYSYTFKGWTPTVKAADGDAEYTAEFERSVNSYTVTWKNWDGTVLDEDTVEYGHKPVYVGAPQRPATDQHSYTFKGWDKEVVEVTGDVTYTATYEESVNSYTVTWQNWDGTELATQTLEYGAMPSYEGTPARPGTDQYSYTFKGWDKEVVSVTGDAVYTATYDRAVNKYTIVWQKEDGTTIKTETVEYGTVLVAPAAPAKTNTAQYTYTFAGWERDDTVYAAAAIPAVQGNAEYRATYTETLNHYTVTWLNYNGATLETDQQVAYGAVPSFESTNLLTREDANSHYEFLGWYLDGDATQTLVRFEGDGKQTVTGNITYRAKYNVTPKARTVTINLWANATSGSGANGTLQTIHTVTNGTKDKLYLVPLDSSKNPVADKALYVPAQLNSSGAYTASVLPGEYYIYAGTSPENAEREAVQTASVVQSDVSVHLRYNSVTYLAEQGTFPNGQTSFTEYYKYETLGVLVSQTVPTRSGYVFTHWEDQNGGKHTASTQGVPVTLTSKITQGYTLTANWVEEAKVTVTVKINPKDTNGYADTALSGKTLNLHLTRSTTENGAYADENGAYAEVYGTGKSAAYGTWNDMDANGYYTYSYEYTGQSSKFLYSANATLAGYAKVGNTQVTKTGNNTKVTIELAYDPDGFDLEFVVQTAPGMPQELVPRAVDIQLAFYDREQGKWRVVPAFADGSKSMEVVLKKEKESDNIWQGTGSYHVWSKYTTAPYAGELYLYRVAVNDFDLGVNRGSLDAHADTDFVSYYSEQGNYHPQKAYTATVQVTDLNCNKGEAGNLKGAHVADDKQQHGTLTVTVNVAPYDVVLHYLNDEQKTETIKDRFLMPDLNTAPVRQGYTFGGWYTKDGSTTDDWGQPAAAQGTAIMNQPGADLSGKTLNLYARWNKDLTVTGKVDISNWYLQDGKKNFIHDHDRPDSVVVQLLKADGSRASVLFTDTITLTDVVADGETAETADYRTDTYTFNNIPDDGSTYRIFVQALNFTEVFQNEPSSFGSNKLEHSTYTADAYTVVDYNGDDKAEVNVYMTFNPAEFDLYFTVDATAIGEGFRPSNAGVVVLYNDRLPHEEQREPQQWPIISQQKQGNVVNPHSFEMMEGGSTKGEVIGGTGTIWHKEPVWRTHPTGDYYGYAVKLWQTTIGGTVYDQTNMAGAPFDVRYSPARAWYDETSGEQTSAGNTVGVRDSGNPHGLVAYLSPKEYTITYELRQPGTVELRQPGTVELRQPGTVPETVVVDGDTVKGNYKWSFGLDSMPTAVATSGAAFDGWYTKDGSSTGDWGEQVTYIRAAEHRDITLYARWKYTVTWKNENGTVLETDNAVVEGTMPDYDGEEPTKAPGAQYSYTFKGWSPALSAVTGNATYTATYSNTTNHYTVTWQNWDGTKLAIPQTLEYGAIPVYNGATPAKAGNAQYSYTFKGWDKALSTVTGDVTYTAVFEEKVNAYTIVWKNWDGTVLDTDLNMYYGDTPVYDNAAAPTKTGDAQYSYTFDGWKAGETTYAADALPTVTGDATYTAVFKETVNTYTVIWKNWDGTTLETDAGVAYGTTPSYNGETPVRAETAQYLYVHNGWYKDIAPVTGDVTYTAVFLTVTRSYPVYWKNWNGTELETDANVTYGVMPSYDRATPTRPADDEFTYTFAGWDKEVVAVTGEVTYTATYSKTKNQYTVTWLDEDGTKVLETDVVDYGTQPVYNKGTPTKAATSQYTYTFAGWHLKTDAENVVDLNTQTVTGNVSYQAKFTSVTNRYTVTWKNADGTVLETDTDVEYGATAHYDGATPTKVEDAQYSYSFIGWSPASTTVTGDVTYTAQYGNTLRKYTITWKNADGTVLETDENIPYGNTPVYNGAEPKKGATAQYTYTFAGWSPTVAKVTGDATYTAAYTETVNQYTVLWVNADGTVLETDRNVPYGTDPSYDGATPTKAADAQYTYTFNSWSPAVKEVSGNVTYTAQYDETGRTYTVIWKNWDGTTLETDTGVAYGTTPTYDGSEPNKPVMPGYTFTWAQWDKPVTAVTGDVTYTAVFTDTQNTYTVTWLNENGGELEKDSGVPYGAMPVYNGATPTKAGNAQYSYTFDGWKAGEITYAADALPTVTGDATYTAVFKETVNTYTVIWKNWDGTTLETDANVYYGTDPSYDGATPVKAADAQYTYTFSGWSPAVETVTGNVTYTAQFDKTLRSYTITWVQDDGTLIDTTTVAYDETPTHADVAKAATAEYTYTFAGWTPALAPVTGTATYKATYTSQVNKYTVTWVDEDGAELKKDENVPYGTWPTAPANPTKAAGAQYSYTFEKWSPTVSAVTGNVTYKATYAQTTNRYDVVWKNYDGTVLRTDKVAYGTTPSYNGATPVKAGNAQYSYTFKGWDKEVVEVTGNVAYTAAFEETVNTYTVTWVNEDDTVLEPDVNVPYGTQPSYDGQEPAKESTGRYSYVFSGWEPAISKVKGDVTYKAKYTHLTNSYAVTWKDDLGNILRVDPMGYGEMPAYGADPEKPATAQYSYTFIGWTPAVSTVTGNAAYTAQFAETVNKYTVTYTDGVSDIVVFADQIYSDVAYGADTPAYVGTPSRSGYTFNGWSPAVEATVSGDAVYTAQWTKKGSSGSESSGTGSSGGGSAVLNTIDHYSYLMGYSDGTLRPYAPITRGQVATIFFRLLTDEARAEYWSQTNSYSDCGPDLWCNNAISTLSNMGIIDGYGDGTFRPNASITRAQFAKMAVGFFETTTREYEGRYGDVSEDAWYSEYVEAASRVGLIQGFGDGTYRPNQNITRAQACVIVNRALGRKPDEDHLLSRTDMMTWTDNTLADWFYADLQEASNSHTYRWLTVDGAPKGMEQWTGKLPQRDWTALEKSWSTAHSAPGGDVATGN